MSENKKYSNVVFRNQAIEYLQILQGENISEKDITFATDLISIGFMIGIEKVQMRQKSRKNHLINIGIIHSEWGQTT